MQITTAARRITRTVNKAAAFRARRWVLYFDADGYEIHRHEPSVRGCEQPDAAYVHYADRRVTQAEIQHRLNGGIEE